MSKLVTLEELEDLEGRAADPELMTAEELDQYQEYLSESQAENAWLRAAENAGWEEALLESYVESGFITWY